MKDRWPLILLAFVMLAVVACEQGTETAVPRLPYTAPESKPASGAQVAMQVPGSPQPTPVPASLERERPRVLHSREQVESEVEDPILALPGDRVWTEEHGRALLKWPDMHLRLYDDTGMQVEDITPTWLHLALDAGAALNGAIPVIEKRIVWTTGYAVITTTATTIMVAYHPGRQLTVLRVFDGQAEMRNLTGEEKVEIVKTGEWALVEPHKPPEVSDRLEEMRGLARELGLWDVFHEIELDVRDGFGPDAGHVPPEDVEIVFVLCSVVTQELSLRTGPGIVYAPPIRGLTKDTVLKPLVRSIDGEWIQVLVEETGEEGWVSADPQYVRCNIDVTSLEIAAAPEVTATPCIPQPPADWQQYVVQRGDTLYSLAREGGTTVQAVIRVNCLTDDTIVQGQLLWLPCIPQPPAGWQKYVVQRGDTLYALVREGGTSAQAVMRVNCLTDATIVQGQLLWLPCIPQPPAGWQQYAVEWGDTLTSLASSHGTTVEQIKLVNCLTNEAIQAGQWLWLPPRLIPETITIELEADADAYVDVYPYDLEHPKYAPNYGFEEDLSVAGDYRRSFVHFNLSSIPAGAIIEDATLVVHLVNMDAPLSSTVSVAQVLSDWTEDEINGSPPPDTSWPESLASTHIYTYTKGVDYSWNVTSLVQDWVDGTSNNYGLMLWGATGDYWFSSREAWKSPPPRLRIRYIEP